MRCIGEHISEIIQHFQFHFICDAGSGLLLNNRGFFYGGELSNTARQGHVRLDEHTA
jgi:hypothetical protein